LYGTPILPGNIALRNFQTVMGILCALGQLSVALKKGAAIAALHPMVWEYLSGDRGYA